MGEAIRSKCGIKYCSGDYQALLAEYGMVASMSRKGACNGPLSSSSSISRPQPFHYFVFTNSDTVRRWGGSDDISTVLTR